MESLRRPTNILQIFLKLNVWYLRDLRIIIPIIKYAKSTW